jgi:sarcosine oxidase subunit alpha
MSQAQSLSGCLTDPSRPLTFTFEGRTIPAIAGQSIGAALYASGVRIFTRSFKYHRPRGLFCVSGDCPNCIMQVDGRPNVRTCIEPVKQGQVVCHQNAWPSLNFDVLRVFDYLHHFLPVGFYYKRFHKPRWLWPIFEHVVRHIAGLGRVDVNAKPQAAVEVEHVHTEVCVVGGGPAGLAAANAAAEAGANVLLIERLPLLCGHQLYEVKRLEDVSRLRALPTTNEERRRTLMNTTVFGLYEGNLLGARQGDRLLKIRAKQIIVCTGNRRLPVPFRNNDLPGIMSIDGVLRLARLYGVRAGQRAVLLSDQQDRLAEQLSDVGIQVIAGIQYPPLGPEPASIIQVRGNKTVQSVRSVKEFECDLLCLGTEQVPANELLLQGGMRFHYQSGRWKPSRSVPGLFAAGGAAGITDLESQVVDGRLRGWEAAAALGFSVPQPSAPVYPGLAFEAGPGTAEALRLSNAEGGGKQFVCLCEDVTVKDIDQAVAEGFDGIETLKRYSTVNMGPCQGKMCSQTAIALCARATGREINAVGATTSRPPAAPVELAVLAADRKHHPVRRTPLHHWHQEHGARWLDAGQWKRPESYGDPLAEVKMVRSGVGLIDVSTLGKIEIAGPQAAELLERVCLQKWADMKPGRVRYSAMCTEEGILFDDGIGGCLGPERYYLTASTGNAEAVFQWLELWRTTWKLDATVLNRTSALAAMNLAGPKSREVLGKLTQLDLSSAAFGYPGVREGEVAGVQCRLLRIGFVGELGYEIHCPSAYAWHLWTTIMEAGKEFGLKPFGVEAQRILRLEKGHAIIGQDTDALSNPLDAGLDWLIRFDKPAFHGKAPLVRLKEMRSRSRLVGFECARKTAPKVASFQEFEGCQVVENGRPVGRLTSMRGSPTLQKIIGLAWIPAAKAAPGTEFVVRCNGSDFPATVAPLPFYDPEGQRLKA